MMFFWPTISKRNYSNPDWLMDKFEKMKYTCRINVFLSNSGLTWFKYNRLNVLKLTLFYRVRSRAWNYTFAIKRKFLDSGWTRDYRATENLF